MGILSGGGSGHPSTEKLYPKPNGVTVPADSTPDRKSTRLNSSHLVISYAVFCLKKNTSLLPSAGVLLTALRHPRPLLRPATIAGAEMAIRWRGPARC